MNFSRSRFRNCFCELFLMNWFKYKPRRSTLDEELHLILLSSFNRIHLGSKFKKQPFRVFPLNSIEDKHSKLISLINSPYEVKYRWNEYHKYSCITDILNLLVVNSFIWWFLFLFRLEFNFKEQSFRVYRGQWDILIILPKKSVLLGFHCS